MPEPWVSSNGLDWELVNGLIHIKGIHLSMGDALEQAVSSTSLPRCRRAPPRPCRNLISARFRSTDQILGGVGIMSFLVVSALLVYFVVSPHPSKTLNSPDRLDEAHPTHPPPRPRPPHPLPIYAGPRRPPWSGV